MREHMLDRCPVSTYEQVGTRLLLCFCAAVHLLLPCVPVLAWAGLSTDGRCHRWLPTVFSVAIGAANDH